MITPSELWQARKNGADISLLDIAITYIEFFAYRLLKKASEK